MILFLSLKDVTALHCDEINEAVYLQGEENKRFEANYAVEGNWFRKMDDRK